MGLYIVYQFLVDDTRNKNNVKMWNQEAISKLSPDFFCELVTEATLFKNKLQKQY